MADIAKAGVASGIAREPSTLALALRIARSELKAGLGIGFKGFRVLILCLAIGVAAIAGVGSLSTALTQGLRADGQAILGGDVEFRLTQRGIPAAEENYLAGEGRLSVAREMRGMARTADGGARALVELKAVDVAYPLYGTVVLDPAMSLGQALADQDGVPGAVVDPLVLDRLGLKLGDRIRLGDGQFEIRARLTREPDAGANPFKLGPRVMIARAALAGTGLDQPGTISVTVARLKLDAGVKAADVIAAANRTFPDAGWRARDTTEAAPSIRNFLDRTGLFLGLVGLTALLVGGVGVGNAVAAHLGEKTETIATLKCLGASARVIFTAYLIEIAALALVGVALGLVIGAVAPWGVVALAGDKLPVAARLALYPRPLGLSALFGALVALAFSLWPLARARGVPAAALFRAAILGLEGRLGWRDGLATVVVALALACLAIGTADDKRLAFWFVGGVVAALVLFRGASAGIMAAARRLPAMRWPSLRLAVANLHRPGAATPSVVLSLGLGLTVLVAVALVESSLGREVTERLPAAAPSTFFIDIQPDEVPGFTDLARQAPGITDLERVPNLRARIVKLNGVPVDQAPVEPSALWAVRGERGLTYAATLPAGSRVVNGAWWPADYQGPPLVSLDANLAEGLHLKLGDTITFSVAGREVSGTLANFRHIEWSSLGINFFTIFSPGALEHAPQTNLATVRADTPAAAAALERSVTDKFPNVSAIRVKDVLDTINQIMGDIATSIRITAAITLGLGALVLSGAIAAGQQRRVYEAIVLKVLGGTRRRIALGFLIEYGLLGLTAAAIAAGLGTIAAWALTTRVMHGEWSFDGWRVVETALASVALTLVVGFAGTWRALGAKAAARLRDE
ncbi:glycosyl transferase family 1 [Aliidongia dinghuensis]|uniref:Glycosyl transferase family 1 n=1 Tax=Aliidongia dinghuensis TaxID=1867774 RepID=A0A8J3E3I7_9PROT|nr:FtsX-like permease family protein [Aliidongia dinghuensis]GGF30642.1 glycosyl transferase family 1 [Aliidongia dinghuensis]